MVETCRICFAYEKDTKRLISPCQCKGSIRWVHSNCLKEWRKSLITRGQQATNCDLCKQRYTFTATRDPFALDFMATNFVRFLLCYYSCYFFLLFYLVSEQITKVILYNCPHSAFLFVFSLGVYNDSYMYNKVDWLIYHGILITTFVICFLSKWSAFTWNTGNINGYKIACNLIASIVCAYLVKYFAYSVCDLQWMEPVYDYLTVYYDKMYLLYLSVGSCFLMTCIEIAEMVEEIFD